MSWRLFWKSSLTKKSETGKKMEKEDGKGIQETVDEFPPLKYPCSGFRMPLHYPRYKKADYEVMEEWKLDLLLQEYGFTFSGTLHDKRCYAIGAFLWPQQL